MTWAMPDVDFGAMFYLKGPHELALGADEPTPNYILSAGIPCFLLFIAVEWAISAALRLARGHSDRAPSHRASDVGMSASMGVFQYLYQHISSSGFELLGIGSELAIYRLVYRHGRLQTIEPASHPWLTWITLFLVKDLAYYTMHRALHAYHVGWTAHVVHHSGEDCNMGAGLRQGALQSALGLPINVAFQLPLALLGFSPTAYGAHAQLNLLYQFWVHTELVDRLPLGLEYILNTPSAHRMHHRPPGNCNYAGVLIIWDRLFGTYRPELKRRDFYGLAKQPPTFGAVTMNLIHWRRMANIPGGWRKRLMARRVRHPWICDPRLLLKPIPAAAGDDRDGGPARTKWEGATPRHLRRWASNIAGTLLALSCGIVSMYISKTRPSLDMAAAFVGMVAVHNGSKLWDRRDCVAPAVAILGAALALVTLLRRDDAAVALRTAADLGLSRRWDLNVTAGQIGAGRALWAQ